MPSTRTYQRRISTYQRRISKLLDMLAELEWVQPTYNGSPSCAYCGHQQHWGHTKRCGLKVMLGDRATHTEASE